LFAGAHADVGGGYRMVEGESDLSHLSLQWMGDQLTAEGVRMKRPATELFPGSPFGPSHQPWTEFPWTVARSTLRRDPMFLTMPKHPSLVSRIEKGGPYKVLPSGGAEVVRKEV